MRQEILNKLRELQKTVEQFDETKYKRNVGHLKVELKYRYNKLIDKLNDLEKKQTRTSLTVAKRDTQGSNCPRVGSIIYKYERGFPIEISEWWFIGVVCIVVVCTICSTRKRK